MSAKHEYMSRISAVVLTALLCALFLLSVPVKAEAQVFYINPDRNITQGQKAMNDGDYETAVKYLSKAVLGDLASDHKAVVQNSLCAALFFEGDHEAAIEACTVAIEEDGRYWKAYVNRGHARKALGDLGGALADYCQANALSPKHVSGPFVSQCEG